MRCYSLLLFLYNSVACFALFPCRGSDCFFGEWGHNRVACFVGVQTVLAEILFQETAVVNHGRKIVEVGVAMVRGVIPDPLIERKNFLWWTTIGHDERLAVRGAASIINGQNG